ncbi:MAG: lecithin retinol acyltransferase family protein [Ghiorsea sp.]|nr:lecithin retinol acyltransferase family protein [Ghiorsea sp.]
MHKFPVGAIVGVPFLGVLKHVGVISDRIINGKPTVFSASQKTGVVQEEDFDSFSEGKPVKLVNMSGNLSGVEVVQRARSKKGEKYSLFFWNCEHFACWCHGLKVESKQLQFFGTVACLAFLLWARKRS